jgi:hypothetical protein
MKLDVDDSRSVSVVAVSRRRLSNLELIELMEGMAVVLGDRSFLRDLRLRRGFGCLEATLEVGKLQQKE